MEAIQELLRKGSVHEAQTRIRALAGKRMRDRERALRLAYLARLARLPEVGLRLLRGRVRGGSGVATREEKAEYGMALAEVGAGREALALLAEIDIARVPWIFHGYALAYFRNWEWDTAIPTIERFLGRRGISTHDRLWGGYFLGRAVQHGPGDIERARTLLAPVAREARKLDYPVLAQDATLALVDGFIIRRDWAQALKSADEMREGLDPRMHHSLKQREAEVALFRSPGSKSAIASMRKIMAFYSEARLWESLRDCERQIATATRDDELFVRVYVGTPYVGARKLFLREYGWTAAMVPSHLDWPHAPRRGLLDVRSGSGHLKAGQLALRVVGALCSDFYSPPPIPALFELLYPGEHYHPTAGPERARHALKWARRALVKAALPIEIEERRARYALRVAPGFALRISTDHAESKDPLDGILIRVREALGCRSSFDTAWFASVTALSERSAQRLLSQAGQRGLIEPIGSGRARRYRLHAR